MKPILFNTGMVRAILDGRKTQTRRIMKPQPELVYTLGKQMDAVNPNEIAFKVMEKGGRDKLAIPPYQPGDIIWVRETWCKNGTSYLYKAGCPHLQDNMWIKWRPSIHMPKDAARIFLKVTDVKVEKLQVMCVDDAINEGAWGSGIPSLPFSLLYAEHPNASCTAVASFAHIWDSTIKKQDLDKYGWDANPWVWVIEFKRSQEGGSK